MTKDIDLKLLKLIHTLVMCGSVTEAARILNQSPGNISHQLRKLREITGSHLFIRTRTGMKPVSAARELSQRYQQYNTAVTQLPRGKEETCRETITVHTWSLMEMMFSCNAFMDKAASFPFRYIFKSWSGCADTRIYQLKNNLVDIDIGSKLPAQKGISAIRLFTAGVSVLAGELFSSKSESLSQQEWETARHMDWTEITDYYNSDIQESLCVSRLLNSRNIKVVSASMINMVSLCARSDHIMLVPDFVAAMLMKVFPVRCLALPDGLKLRSDCYLHYHENLSKEPDVLSMVHPVIGRLQSMLALPGQPWPWAQPLVTSLPGDEEHG
ncbi:LysR family transcriptional regulator [Enterobacteriaceae bacterium H16N7]|nr:LysR family transcriptional regulator [Dryocola clanedunensis]